LSKKGYKVGAFKPIETGVIDIPSDASILLKTCKELNQEFQNITIKEICPIQFSLPSAPYVAKQGENIDFEMIKSSYNRVKQHCDILLIEGAGGLLVPVCEDFYMIDFINFFNAHALLVTHDKLGSINDTLLSLKALKSENIPHTWCINNFKESKDFDTITLPFYRDKFEEIFSLQTNLDALTQKLITDLTPNTINN